MASWTQRGTSSRRVGSVIVMLVNGCWENENVGGADWKKAVVEWAAEKDEREAEDGCDNGCRGGGRWMKVDCRVGGIGGRFYPRWLGFSPAPVGFSSQTAGVFPYRRRFSSQMAGCFP